MLQFFAELRRRKVFRSTIAYVVAAWLVIQVADVIVEPLHLPQWALTGLIVVAAAGLPVVVIVSWLFDIGPSGLERDTGATGTGSDAEAVDTPSVAVMPFIDLSPDGDHAYFCNG
ncbi:MAG: hypothetical protein KJO55_08775, partial [Gammaproteobacteria bacterium]|nr:hypothetical protein [Gammaproteobacteria bacterium]